MQIKATSVNENNVVHEQDESHEPSDRQQEVIVGYPTPHRKSAAELQREFTDGVGCHGRHRMLGRYSTVAITSPSARATASCCRCFQP